MACVEGVILLVDATQGIQAQTISNAYKALEKNLLIIPAINKIDLPSADVLKAKKQLVDFLGINEVDVFEISAKTGENVENLLKAVVKRIPAPYNISTKIFSQDQLTFRRSSEPVAPRSSSESEGSLPRSFAQTTDFRKNFVSTSLQSLIFDSYYDSHRGVIAFVRVFSGEFKKNLHVALAINDEIFEIKEVGHFTPDLKPTDLLAEGDIGYVVTNLKDIHKVRVGDTIINEIVRNRNTYSLPGYKRIKPMIFASVFPTDTHDYLNLKKALEKLYLSDSSLEFSAVYSQALGAGFRVGFLGLLHADVARERLEREFNLSLVLTPPQVEYRINRIEAKTEFMEPFVKIMIVTPELYLGDVMQLSQSYRAKFITMDNKNQIVLYYEMPMSEMISDFYDKLKSVSSGYASLDWEFLEYRVVDADKLMVLINGDPIEEFSEVVAKARAQEKGQSLVKRLGELIPRQMYEVKIQAQYKGKIIASERIAPFRKDVTKKLYGGDRTRKDKLLDKQKEGKKKMKMIGRVEVPKEAFLKLFRR